MAEGVRIELTSSILETEVLAFERPLNIQYSSVRAAKRLSALPWKEVIETGGGDSGIRTHTERIFGARGEIWTHNLADNAASVFR